MTARRRRMLECLQLRGVSERSPAQRRVRAYAGHGRPGRAPTGGALSPITRREQCGSTPPRLPRRQAYPAGLPPGEHDRAGRHPVLLRADPPPRLDHLALCASATRAKAAGAPPSRSGAQASRRRELAARPRVPHHDRRRWSPAAGGDPSAGARSRALSYAEPRPSWSGRERAGCPLAAPDAGPASPVWGHAPSSRPALPGTRPWWARSVERGDVPPPWPRVPCHMWRPEAAPSSARPAGYGAVPPGDARRPGLSRCDRPRVP